MKLHRQHVSEMCKSCRKGDCYGCSIAGTAWAYSREFELRSLRKLKEKAIQRLQREISQIDEELDQLHKSPREP